MHAPLLYQAPEAYSAAPRKAVALFGMSGLGKTRLASLLRASGRWFHYSVDYRIGTRYMGEHIVDNFKREAMRVPLLRELLMSDSIYIGSNITFDNLSPLSTYLGKPGDPAKGGIAFDEYLRRQRQHREAEIRALLDTPDFLEKARGIYGYDHFLADTGGSICEVVDPEDPADPVLTALSGCLLLVQIRGSQEQEEELARRFARAPKPIYWPESFLVQAWDAYRAETGLAEDAVDPDEFMVWGFRRLLAERIPRYEAMARNWGVSVESAEAGAVRDADDFDRMIEDAIARKLATA